MSEPTLEQLAGLAGTTTTIAEVANLKVDGELAKMHAAGESAVALGFDPGDESPTAPPGPPGPDRVEVARQRGASLDWDNITLLRAPMDLSLEEIEAELAGLGDPVALRLEKRAVWDTLRLEAEKKIKAIRDEVDKASGEFQRVHAAEVWRLQRIDRLTALLVSKIQPASPE